MNDQELQNIWQQYDAKLQKCLRLNEYLVESLQAQKARKEIKSLLPARVIGIVIGGLYMWFLAAVTWRYNQQPFFAVSLAMIIIVTGFAVADYIIQVIIIGKLNYTNTITETQKQLSILQSSIIRNVRVSFLQLPFYTTFYINDKMLQSANTNFWLFQIAITGLFVLLTIFLYKAISYKNINKRWVKGLLNGSGWKSATKALNFLKEIDEFEKEVA